MGAKSADTQREIAGLRQDVASAIEELESRARHLFDLGSRVRSAQHDSRTLATVAVVGLAMGGFVAYKIVSSARQRSTVNARLEQAVAGAAERAASGLQNAGVKIPVDVSLTTRGVAVGRSGLIEVRGGDASMVKKILWVVLATAMMAGAGLLANRLSAVIWKAAMKEDPPLEAG